MGMPPTDGMVIDLLGVLLAFLEISLLEGDPFCLRMLDFLVMWGGDLTLLRLSCAWNLELIGAPRLSLLPKLGDFFAVGTCD